jgi:hypothetical protein
MGDVESDADSSMAVGARMVNCIRGRQRVVALSPLCPPLYRELRLRRGAEDVGASALRLEWYAGKY